MILSNMTCGYFPISDADIRIKWQHFQINYLKEKRKLKNILLGLAAAEDS